MQALQTLSQREFEMMQCFWEADEPLKMKELQTRWAHGETPQSRSTTLIYVNRLVEMKYLYKTVEQKRQVLYHPIVTKEDNYNRTSLSRSVEPLRRPGKYPVHDETLPVERH